MTRILLVILLLMATAGAVVAYGDPDQIARARENLTQIFGRTVAAAAPSSTSAPAVQIARSQGGEFAFRAKING
ncbi:MAG: TIGR02281 family clan AA aspartic protease, partial [Bradyrhizobium sp.]